MIEEEETPPDISLRNLIETKIIVEFEIQDGLVHEEAQMQFKPDILVKDMIEKIIFLFSRLFSICVNIQLNNDAGTSFFFIKIQ